MGRIWERKWKVEGNGKQVKVTDEAGSATLENQEAKGNKNGTEKERKKKKQWEFWVYSKLRECGGFLVQIKTNKESTF